MIPTYDIISVDWNAAQTELWLHWVHENCPRAAVQLISNQNPYPWCWSGTKVKCFSEKFQTDRVLYMDTDTIVTRDLEFLFDLMDGQAIGASSKIPIHPFNKNMKLIDKIRPLLPAFGNRIPKHLSSGAISLNHMDPMSFWGGWDALFKEFSLYIPTNHYFDEITFSFLVGLDDYWDMPLEVHGNICGKTYFGEAEVPAILHYHKPSRLAKYGLVKWLDISH